MGIFKIRCDKEKKIDDVDNQLVFFARMKKKDMKGRKKMERTVITEESKQSPNIRIKSVLNRET